ncbi:MAG TPA: hypothetical protein VFW96_20285 [Thermomicrobiales bacterium]|nr:hypothetical protein [Thermomicrobiales bacterium]
MTATVTRATLTFLASGTLDAVTGTAGLVVSLLLAALLLHHELLRVAGGEGAARLRRALGVVIAPLLLAFVLLVALRIAMIARFGHVP